MFTNEFKKVILNTLCGNTSGSSAYLALSQTMPNVEGGGVTEPVGGGYERALLGVTSSSGGGTSTHNMGNITFDPTTGKTTITNTNEIHFKETTTSWGSLPYFAIYSSASGGTPKYVGQLTTTLTPVANNVVIIRVGDIKISVE